MTYRVTRKMLDNKCEHLNTTTGQPVTPYEFDEAAGRRLAQIGNYHIDEAYGGVSLVQMVNAGGGVRTIIHRCTKRELAERIDAFMAGHRAATD